MTIINANIFPIESAEIKNGYIVTEGGKIKEFGDMKKYKGDPSTAKDLCGAMLFPGFIDCHTHLGMFGDSVGFESEDGNEETDPVTPNLRAIDAVNPQDKGFAEALAAGITTVVSSPGSANPVGGQLVALKTLGNCIDEMVVSDKIGIKFAFGENPKTVYNTRSQTPTTRMATAALIRESLKRAQRYADDIEKANEDPDTDSPETDLKSEALLELLAGKQMAHIHAHRADDIATAIRICKEFNLKYVLVHATEGHLISDFLKKENADVICGPIISHRSKPELKNATTQNAALLTQAGLRVAICTDHPEVPIDFLALSAAVAMRDGLDRQKALEALTIVPAQLAGIDKRVGSIKKNKDADFVVYNSDPFLVASKPTAVVVGGEFVNF